MTPPRFALWCARHGAHFTSTTGKVASFTRDQAEARAEVWNAWGHAFEVVAWGEEKERHEAAEEKRCAR